MRRITAPAVALGLFIALVLGLCTFTRPASAAASAPVRAGIADWTWTTPSPPPPSKRVIEVVDKIGPREWRVSTAVNWLDKYTASDMRLVARCSGKAYRCITVRQGRVGKWRSGAVGWSKNSTVTIDTGKAKNSTYKRWYRYDKNRTWLLIHELAHQHGLGHSTGRNVMNQYVTRYKLVLTTSQRAHLRKR